MADIKKAILQAKIEGALYDILIQTKAENVEYTTDEGTTTTVAAQIAAMLTNIAALPTSEEVAAELAALEQKLLGDLPKEAFDTFSELAAYIEEHQEAADALTAAIGDKLGTAEFDAFKETLGSLATKSTVSESDLDEALAEKVNAAAEGNHSHANKEVLDGITADKVADWDHQQVYIGTEAPADMKDGDILLKIIE